MMRKTWMLLAGVGLALGVPAVWAQQQGGLERIVTGSQFHFDEKDGVVTVTDSSINRPGISIKSRSSGYRIDEDGATKTVSLKGAVEVKTGAAIFTTDAATYYPELDTLTAREFRLVAGDRVSAQAAISFTCSGGTLYGDGAAIPGGRYSNCDGGASILQERIAASGYTITCGGSGGNQVILRRGCFD